MSVHNRVVWSEGLFLQPHHFQQQDRHFEAYVETRCQSLIPNSWGFTELEIERDLLTIGKFGLRRAAGVFPDGTPFRMPDEEPLPTPMEVAADIRDQTLYLSIPLRRAGGQEVTRDGGLEDLSRHAVRELSTRDASTGSGEEALLEVGALRTRLMFGADAEAYAQLPLAHIVERRSDRQLVLDDGFIPSVLHSRTATRLATLTTELLGLFHQRGEALAGRVSATGRGSAAEFADFLMLQVVNRYEPLLAHYADSGALHPEDLFQICVAAAGELATFTTSNNRPPRFPGYRHERLRESFDPVIFSLRESLSKVLTQTAIPIPLEPRKFGIRVAIVADRTLLNDAVFVLAARADLPSEELRRRFPAQLKIGPSERITDLVRLGLPGVPVIPLAVAPRQIPYHAGFAYFELDQSHELWDQLKNSGGLAMHVTGDFPGLGMEFWAIRSS